MKFVPIEISVPDYPIWEIRDVEIPPEVSEELSRPDSWIDYNSNPEVLTHPPGRYVNREGLSSHAFQLTIEDWLAEQRLRMSDPPFEEAMRRYWPFSIDVLVSARFIRDTPGYQMARHIDNRNVFAAGILNIENNETSTLMYHHDDVVYRAPTQKGTGFVFLNTHMALHEISNFSNRHRTVLLINMMFGL